MQNEIEKTENEKLAEFYAAAESFIAAAPSITNVRVLRAQFAPINAAICGDKASGILPLPIPPSKWPVCDAAISAYKRAFMRLI